VHSISIITVSVLLKQSFSSLVYHNNSLNSIILSFIYLTISHCHLSIVLAVLVSFFLNMSFAQHFSAVCKSCFHNVRYVFVIILIKVLPALLLLLSITLKLTFVALFLYNLPAVQTNRLQLVLNFAARAVTKTPEFHHITHIIKSIHWLNINKRIKCKVITLKHINLSILVNLLPPLSSFHSHRLSRAFSFITLSPPSLTSRLKIANRSFCHSAPVLWNSLPSDLRHVAYLIMSLLHLY